MFRSAPRIYFAAASVSRKLLIVTVLMLTEINEAGRSISMTNASKNCSIFAGFVLKCHMASAYAVMDAAKLNTLIVVKILVFCELSLGISIAYNEITVIVSATQIAIAT